MLYSSEANPRALAGPSAPVCSHHWVIEPPSGPVSLGVCQDCQETREFKNSIPWEYWQRKSGGPTSS